MKERIYYTNDLGQTVVQLNFSSQYFFYIINDSKLTSSTRFENINNDDKLKILEDVKNTEYEQLFLTSFFKTV